MKKERPGLIQLASTSSICDLYVDGSATKSVRGKVAMAWLIICTAGQQHDFATATNKF